MDRIRRVVVLNQISYNLLLNLWRRLDYLFASLPHLQAPWIVFQVAEASSLLFMYKVIIVQFSNIAHRKS